MLGRQPVGRRGRGAQPLALAAPGRHPQALLAPQPLDGLAVHPRRARPGRVRHRLPQLHHPARPLPASPVHPAKGQHSPARICLRSLTRDRYGISRHSLHAWRRRFEQDGLPGLADRPRRPRTSPHRLPAEVEALVCGLRRQHPRWGARRLVHELGRRGVAPVPGRATVHRVLVRNGLVTRQAQQHKRKYRRWQRDAPMQLWQLDLLAGVRLAGGREAELVTGVDDHFRFAVVAAVVAIPAGARDRRALGKLSGAAGAAQDAPPAPPADAPAASVVRPSSPPGPRGARCGGGGGGGGPGRRGSASSRSVPARCPRPGPAPKCGSGPRPAPPA
jgi:transposase